MMTLRSKGDFKNIDGLFERTKGKMNFSNLDKYGRQGVEALKSATPKDSGVTSESWSYKIERKDGSVSIQFLNSNINKGVPIAIILQYGHTTGTGGYVQGVDYINPAVRPIFDKITEEAWKEVSE